jgi:hypothetical protein
MIAKQIKHRNTTPEHRQQTPDRWGWWRPLPEAIVVCSIRYIGLLLNSTLSVGVRRQSAKHFKKVQILIENGRSIT